MDYTTFHDYHDGRLLCWPLEQDSYFGHEALSSNTTMDRTSWCHSPSVSMERYFQEQDRRLFTAGLTESQTTIHAIPSEIGPLTYLDQVSYPHILTRHMPSPSDSGPSSSNLSSTWSDRQSTPWSSPRPSVAAHSPDIANAECPPYSYGGYCLENDNDHVLPGSCVALHDVQYSADAQPEKVVFDDEHGAYYAYPPQEGYQPMETSDVDTQTNGFVDNNVSTFREERCPNSPNLRRRRVSAARSITSPQAASRVSKRPTTTKRSSSYQSKMASSNGVAANHSSPNRAFPCPFAIYGCASSFGSKNEWKRHVNTQHMRTGYWRCDQCDHGERKPNDFNRKDLFIQHVRRMHPSASKNGDDGSRTSKPGSRSRKSDPDDQLLAATANRCFRRIRSPPAKSGCLFCDARFNGPNTWDERLEHIGRHMEGVKKENEDPTSPEDWQEDSTLQEWLMQEGIVAKNGNHLVLTDGRP